MEWAGRIHAARFRAAAIRGTSLGALYRGSSPQAVVSRRSSWSAARGRTQMERRQTIRLRRHTARELRKGGVRYTC